MLRFLLMTMFVLTCGYGSIAAAERRVALVIGNGAYLHGDALTNPVNDAKDMALSLERLGFEIHRGFDLAKVEMEKLIRSYAKATEGADLALVFYAGHGIQVGGENYLLPVDAAPQDAKDLDFFGVRTDLLMRQINRNTRYRVVMLDACRDNPFPNTLQTGNQPLDVGRGLAEMSVPEGGNGSLIVFATDPGNIALDGTGDNSPFTSALLRHIETPNVNILTMLTHVNRDVAAQTNGKQRPWMSGSLTGEVFLARNSRIAGRHPLTRTLSKIPVLSKMPAVSTLTAPAPFETPPTGSESVSNQIAALAPTQEDLAGIDLKETELSPEFIVERDLFRAAQNSEKTEDYRAYLSNYPNGHYAQIARNAIVRLKNKPEMSIANRLTAATTALVAAPAAKNRDALETMVTSEATEDALDLNLKQQRGVQRRLSLLGFNVGQPDGVPGPFTRRAISRWQAKNDFYESGFLNKPQYDELVRQARPKYAKWLRNRRQKLALARTLAKKHAGGAGLYSSPVQKFKSFFTRTFPVTEKPGPVQDAIAPK